MQYKQKNEGKPSPGVDQKTQFMRFNENQINPKNPAYQAVKSVP